MQIVSNTGYRQQVHYEAPPSKGVPYEMEKYIDWFNNCELPALTKASIAHVYFELIHPFTDGNGRIGRALVIKSLAQSLQQPIMLALSKIIEKNKKEYYTNIAACNHTLEITAWIKYFSNAILKTQEYSIDYVKFVIAKAKLFDRVTNLINERQRKVINQILQEGPDGFVGGMNADKYIAITQTSRATATRDLQDLVAQNIFRKEGKLKSTRYYLIL